MKSYEVFVKIASMKSSGAEKDRDRTDTEYGAGDRRREEIAHRMMSVSPHHQEARPAMTHLLQQHFRRRRLRSDGMEPVWHIVRGQEVAGEPRDCLRFRRVAVDGHDHDLLPGRQSEKDEGLQGARALASAAVAHNDPLSFRQ